MFKNQTKLIIINILILVVKEVYLQILPTSPCPTIFQYHYDGMQWIGKLRINNPPINQLLHLKITLSVSGKPLTNYLGEIELLTRGPGSHQHSTVFYNVKFPISSIPPKLINVIVNNRTICLGPQDFGIFVTLIQLEHTREFSFLQKTELAQPNEFLNDDNNEAIKDNSPNTLGESEDAFRMLHNTCGRISKRLARLNLNNRNSLFRGSWPWLAAIYVNNNTSLGYICGGTLVSQNVIITAGHCFHLYRKQYNANEIMVFLGRYNLQNWNEDGSIVSSVDSIFIHPDYDNNLSSYDADIAIVILKNRISFNQYVKPICLRNETKNKKHIEGNNGIVIGWGFNEHNVLSTTPERLRTYIVSRSECIKTDRKYRNLMSTRSFCAGGDIPCVGFSGAGLMLYANNRWRLRGIVSSSLPGSCKSNKFIIYTDTNKFLDWIYAFII